MVAVGDTVTREVHFGDEKPCRKEGRVIYVHPAVRFYTVEFQFGGGPVRESYFPEDRGGDTFRARRGAYCPTLERGADK